MSESVARRIALVQTQAEAAGAQEISRLLKQDLEKLGWTVRQIFLFRRTASFDLDKDVAFCARERPASLPALIKCFARLYHELREFRPEAVISFQHYGNIGAGVAARAARIPFMIASQVSASEVIRKPVRVADRLGGCVGLYDRIIVNSKETEEFYRAYPPSYSRRVIRIDHGFEDKTVSLSKVEARRAIGLPENGVILGCAARLHPMKQIDFAINMLADCPDWRLALAGQGEDKARLQAIVDSKGLAGRVDFMGEIAPERIGLFLAALDCFVFPSAAETFGLAAVEAAQAGVPVVANRLDVLEHVLAVDGEPCALFVNVRDESAFSEAVRTILTDPHCAERLRKAGRRLALRFPRGAMADGYSRVITELAERRYANRIRV